MSCVTNIILTGSFAEEDVEKIRKLISELEPNPMPVMRNSGKENTGTKAMESDVYLMAFNNFKTPEFVSGLKDILILSKWKDGTNAQILIKGEDDETFKELYLV